MQLMVEEKRKWEVLSLSLVLGLALAMAALLFFAWLANEVLEGELQHFDEVTRVGIHQLASPALTSAMRGISFLGSTVFLTTATSLIVIWFALRHWRRAAILFAITMIGAAILNTTLKLTFKRSRPVPYFNLLAPESYSFPSGHALASFCFYGALAAILTARTKNRRVRIFLSLGCGAMVLLIGFSRIYLGVHYTTDVLAGYSAAFIWVLVVRIAVLQLARRRNNRTLRTIESDGA
jgi:undecaprenyl-diphosphatase